MSKLPQDIQEIVAHLNYLGYADPTKRREKVSAILGKKIRDYRDLSRGDKMRLENRLGLEIARIEADRLEMEEENVLLDF